MTSLLNLARPWLAMIFILLSGLAHAAPANDIIPVDRIVAVVDRDVITYGELQDRIKSSWGSWKKRAPHCRRRTYLKNRSWNV